MEFRRMEEKDLKQVTAIENDTFSIPWTKKDFLDSIKNPAYVYIVACEKDMVCGYCGMWGIAGEGQINNVAVKKEFRSQGVGFGMMDYMLEEGRRKGMEAFTLEVRESNLPAISLYKKLGFYSAGIRKGFYEKPKEDAVIMWKTSL